MLKTFLLALCCAACVFTLIPQARPSTPADRDSDSDEVYAAVVNWRTAHPGEEPKAKRLVFLDTTVEYSCFAEKPEDCATKVREELTRAFGHDLDASVLNDYLEDRSQNLFPRAVRSSGYLMRRRKLSLRAKSTMAGSLSMPNTPTRAASWRFHA